MGLFGHFASPRMLALALTTSGLQKCRLTYDKATDEVVLTVMVADQIRHFRAPCQVTYTVDEIARWLAGETPIPYPEQQPLDPAQDPLASGNGAETPTSS
jgi:hypothetical protein